MRYNITLDNYNMITTSSSGSAYAKPLTAAELKAEAMQALAAWQKVLKAETEASATLDGLLVDMAAQISDKKEAEKIDAAIRAEWLARKKTDVIIPPTLGG